MRSFGDFIFICEEKKGRGGPSYNYEEAYIKLFNHLVKGDKLGVTNGKILRNLVANQDIDGLTDFLAQELNNIKNNKKHPLHFDNIANDDTGFTGKSGKTDAHRDSYYREIQDHFYTFLNDSQSRVGKSMVVDGYVVRRMGEDKIPLSKSGKEDYGKDIDTSKVDIEYYNPRNPKKVHQTSLKKKSGSVLYSAGPKETVGNYKSALRAQLAFSQRTGAITKEQAEKIRVAALEKIELLGVEIENTRNKTKEEQEDALGIINGVRNDIENLVPGIVREVGLQAASGEGKFDKDKVVQSVLSTGRGGGRAGDVREIGAEDRARKTKHPANPEKGKTTSGTALTTGDNRPAISGEPASYQSTSLQSRLDAGELTFDELQRNIEKAQERISAYQTKLDDDGYDEKTSENLQKAKDTLSTYQIFQQKVSEKDTPNKNETTQAQKDYEDALKAQKEAQKKLATKSDGSKRHIQYQGQARANNPDLDAELTYADDRVTTTQNSLSAIKQRAERSAQAVQSRKEREKEVAQQPQPQPEAPKPQQQPQRTEPVDTKPQQKPEEPAKPEVPSPVTPKPEKKKEKKPVQTSNGQLPQE